MSHLKLCDYDSVFLEKSWEWLNDPEIKYLTNTGDFSKNDQQDWFKNLPNLKNYKIWGVTYGQKPIGVFGIKNIQHGEGEYWGYIGEKDFWGAGLTNTIIDLIIDEARRIGMTKLYLKVILDNVRAIKLYQKKGFYISDKETDSQMLIMRKQL